MARLVEAHEIMRTWRVTYESRTQYGATREVIAPDVEMVREFFRARPPAADKINYIEEVTTAEQLAAELERVKPFLEFREAAQAELESKARTSAFTAKTRLYQVLAVATTVGAALLGVGAFL